MNTLQISGKVIKADYHNDQCAMIVLDTLEDGLELNVGSHKAENQVYAEISAGTNDEIDCY
ncbi:hypothetical protein [Moraxella canis]|uniref:Uncharacterized protein n=1 Tax=Moraxella canis TaxID=90239 RepID=A0A1S9ZPD7_9GAMM|nr:hypothetical protein [Moraxella canis]OOR85482.1 hypothetical protein B0180_01445 [Moraxella canis]